MSKRDGNRQSIKGGWGLVRTAAVWWVWGGVMTMAALAGTPEPLAGIERAMQDVQSRYAQSIVRAKLYPKPGAQQQQAGQRPSTDIRAVEATGVVIGNAEVLLPYSNLSMRQIEKAEVWWSGKWHSAVVLGEDLRLGFTVVKVDSPKDWKVVSWKEQKPESGRWAVALLNGGEASEFKVSSAPVWLWGSAKDVNSGGEILYASTQLLGPGVMATFDGEVLGLVANVGVTRWIDKKYLQAIESAKGGSSVGDGTEMTAYYGVNFMPLSVAYVEALKVPTKKAVRVQGVIPGGPASLAGLRADDIITKFNGKELEQSGAQATVEMKNLIQIKPKEGAGKFTVWRQGREVEVPVSPQKRPVAKMATSEELGLTVSEIIPANAHLGQYPTKEGVIVTQVVNGGPSSYAGLFGPNPQRGMPMMILTELAGTPIRQLSDFYSALTKVRQQKGQPILVKGLKGIEYFMTVIDATIGAKQSDGGSSGDSGDGENEEDQP